MSRARVNPPANAAEEIERLATMGHSSFGLAKFFGCSQSTILKWWERFPELKEAYDIGRDTCCFQLTEQIRVMGLCGKNPAGLIYLCKSKFKMFDVPLNATKVDVRVDNRQPVLLVKDHGSDEEWAAKAAEQQRRLLALEPAALPQKALPAPVVTVEPESPRKSAKAPKPVHEAPSWVPPDAKPSAPGKRSPAKVKWKRNA